MDLLGADGGSLAAAFASGCVATWGFVQMVLIGPLKKQITELKDECKERDDRQANRISQLETLLLLHGSGPLRQELQAALSEERVLGDRA
ncbi:hypothetical protein TomTYG75_07280 [Sphingobium sp. TomTYG75]